MIQNLQQIEAQAVLMGTHTLGWIAIVVATFSYGSLFVPVKNYDIHDGIVYQWFQCCGILLAGLLQALWRNDWEAPGLSAPGFYVCREGVLSGVFFQLANVLATQAVRTFGMSHYFTTQKVAPGVISVLYAFSFFRQASIRTYFRMFSNIINHDQYIQRSY